MSYFGAATMTIAETGGYGDYKLPADKFDRDDRAKRIKSAADSLGDWVFEYLMDECLIEGVGTEFGDRRIFKQEHLPIIQETVAYGMMMQFEHDQEMEGTLIAELLKDSSDAAKNRPAV